MGIIVSITGLAVIGLLALDFFGISPQSKKVTETKTMVRVKWFWLLH